MQGIFLNQLILRLGKLNILNLTQRKESCNAYLHVCSRPSPVSFKRFCVHVLLSVSYRVECSREH
jgi:hypothetical protein